MVDLTPNALAIFLNMNKLLQFKDRNSQAGQKSNTQHTPITKGTP